MCHCFFSDADLSFHRLHKNSIDVIFIEISIIEVYIYIVIKFRSLFCPGTSLKTVNRHSSH